MSLYDVCPAGFDCQAASSCPSYTVPCPDGYFCSSYEGNRYESDLDFQYASTVTRYLHDPIDITNRNKKNYIDPDRAIQSACLSGFYCPNPTTILVCPLHFTVFLPRSNFSRLSHVRVAIGALQTLSSRVSVMHCPYAEKDLHTSLISSISSSWWS